MSYNNTTSVSMKVTCGADDTSLIHTHDNFEYLIKETNEELIRISTWLATNKLVLNINKTNYMIFTSRGKSCNKNVTNIKIRVGVKYNWSSTQILQVLVIKYKYKYFAFSPIKYSSTSSTDTPSTSTSVNIGWLIYTGNTRAVIPLKYRPVL